MSQQNLSHKHHYIPRCYLKGFCRSDGTFDVFDKQYSKFRSAPQSPATAFFEKQKNTVLKHGQATDEIEKLYARFESGIGQLFDHIRQGMPSDQLLQPDGIYLLKLHIAIQFWRLPRFDEFSNNYLLSRTKSQIEHLCSICQPNPASAYNVFDLIQRDTGFRHYFRSFWLPLGTFDLARSVPTHLQWTILDVHPSEHWSNHLCSDLPFIAENLGSLLNFSGRFVYPLSSSRLLVSRSRSNQEKAFDPAMSTKISLLLYLQASRYVAGTSREYVEKIIDFSKSYVDVSDTVKLQTEVLAYLA